MTILFLPLDIKIVSYLCSHPPTKKSGEKKKRTEKEKSIFLVSYLVLKEAEKVEKTSTVYVI